MKTRTVRTLLLLQFFELVSRIEAFAPKSEASPVFVGPGRPQLQSSAVSSNFKNLPAKDALRMIHASPWLPQLGRTTLGTGIAYKLATSGIKKGSLTTSGACAAFFVATAAFSCSFRSGLTLIAFYYTGSKLTKVGASRKATLVEEDTTKKEGSGRGAKQVLACSLVSVLCGITRRVWVGTDSALDFTFLGSIGNRLTLAYVAFFACCAGDTWASELGILSKTAPRMVTRPWKKVAPGTNGGMSLIGTTASAVGGACMGLVHSLGRYSSVAETLVLCTVGLLAGLGGSFLDSWLGATLQATYYDSDRNIIVPRQQSQHDTAEQVSGWKFAFLSNEAVNVVSTTITAALAALWSKPILGMFPFIP